MRRGLGSQHSTLSSQLTVQQFRFDAEDAENQGDGGAAEVKEKMAGIDHAAGKIIVVGKDLHVIYGGFGGGEAIAVEEGGLGKPTAADDESCEHYECKDAGDGLVAGERAREDADGDEEEAGGMAAAAAAAT